MNKNYLLLDILKVLTSMYEIPRKIIYLGAIDKS